MNNLESRERPEYVDVFQLLRHFPNPHQIEHRGNHYDYIDVTVSGYVRAENWQGESLLSAHQVTVQGVPLLDLARAYQESRDAIHSITEAV